MTAASAGAAVNEIIAVFLDYYGTANVELPNIAFDPPTDYTSSWARVVIEHVDAGQGSLANVEGKRRWVRSGVGLIELMTPIGEGTGGAYAEAEAVVNLYQGKRTASDVWFRNVRFEERGQRARNPGDARLWHQIDVYFSFAYDQLS